eukprot:6653297-Pyramimonas_sp.AAC.1
MVMVVMMMMMMEMMPPVRAMMIVLLTFVASVRSPHLPPPYSHLQNEMGDVPPTHLQLGLQNPCGSDCDECLELAGASLRPR